MKYDKAREKCTQGEWCTRGDDAAGVVYRSVESCEEVAQTGAFRADETHANAALIAHEHNMFPKLLAAMKTAFMYSETSRRCTDTCECFACKCADLIQEAENVEGI